MIKPIAEATSSQAKRGPVKHDDQELCFPGTFGKRLGLEELQSSHDEARRLIDIGQPTQARRKLVAGLLAYQCDGWSVWPGSELAQKSLSLLFSIGGLEVATKAILPLILNEKFCLDWQLASCLAQCASIGMSSKERKTVSLEFAAHLRAILEPEMKYIPVSQTEKSVAKPKKDDPQECIDFLLISLLDHPDEFLRGRVAEIVRWLTLSRVLSAGKLETRALALPYGPGRELAAGILQNLRRTKLLNSTSIGPHSSQVVEANLLVAKALGLSSPSSRFSAQSYEVPRHRWSMAIDSLLYEDDEQIALANAALSEICAPLKPADSRELFLVTQRALGQPSSLKGTPQEREALFRVASRLPEEEQNDIVEKFASWNPLWPHDLLDIGISESLIRKALAKIESDALQPFLFEQGTLIHAIEISAPPGQRPSQLELVAFFMKNARKLSLPSREQVFQRGSLHFEARKPSPPQAAVKRYPLGATAGGVLTPSTVSDLFKKSGDFRSESIRRIIWQDGRVATPRLGQPLSQGCALFYDFKEDFKTELGWLLLKNGSTTAMICPNRKVVQFYGGNQ